MTERSNDADQLRPPSFLIYAPPARFNYRENRFLLSDRLLKLIECSKLEYNGLSEASTAAQS